MIIEQITQEQIAAIAGVILSLIFSYAPKVKDWFDAKAANEKRLILLGIMAGVILVLFTGSCFSLFNTFICSWDGALDALWLLGLCAFANQTTYALSPRFDKKPKIEYVPVKE